MDVKELPDDASEIIEVLKVRAVRLCVRMVYMTHQCTRMYTPLTGGVCPPRPVAAVRCGILQAGEPAAGQADAGRRLRH